MVGCVAGCTGHSYRVSRGLGLRVQGDLVSRLIMGIIGRIMWVIRGYEPILSPPDPPSKALS